MVNLILLLTEKKKKKKTQYAVSLCYLREKMHYQTIINMTITVHNSEIKENAPHSLTGIGRHLMI